LKLHGTQTMTQHHISVTFFILCVTSVYGAHIPDTNDGSTKLHKNAEINDVIKSETIITTPQDNILPRNEDNHVNDVTHELSADISDVRVKRDVALRLQRYARMAAQRVVDDISYICQELCR
jgi:hypothetical protein